MNILHKIHFAGLSLIVPALCSGPFLPDLIISITGLIFITVTLVEKQYKYYKSYFFIFFIFFNFFLIINSYFSDFPLLSLESSLFYFRFIFLVLSIWYAIENYKKFIFVFRAIFLTTFTLIIFDAYFQYFLGINFLGYIYNQDRLSGIFGDELILGSFLSRLFPLLFALLIITNNKYYMFYSVILFFLIDILIFLSGERLAFFYMILFILIVIFLVNKWKIIRISTFLISAILIFVIINSNQPVKDRMITYTYIQLYDSQNTVETNILKKFRIFSAEHESIFLSAYNMFKDNFIIGIGPKNFREYCKKEKYNTLDSCRSHPHNFYMQLLSETGIIGFIPFFIMFIYLNIIFIRKFLNYFFKNKYIISDYKISLLSCIYISVFPFVPSGNIFNNWMSVIYFLPIGFLFLNEKNYVNQNL